MKRLLIVEDNLEDEALTLRAIARKNLELSISVARDGQEAVEMLGLEEEAPSSELPDFVLLDLKLPKLSGHEVLERMRASDRCRSLPVLVLSSSDEEIDVESAARMGVKHMRKPDDFYVFLDTVGAEIEGLCGLRENAVQISS